MPDPQSPSPTLDAIVEKKARMALERGFRNPMGLMDLEDLERVPTSELLPALNAEGLPCTEQELDELVEACTSSDEVFDRLVERSPSPAYGADSDLAFICLMELCCRRYPDWVSSDTLNRHIFDGYSLLESGADPRTVADVWQRAWKVVPPLARTWRVLSVIAFDKRFRGVHEISTWANDYDLCLSDAARIDDAYVHVRQTFAKEFDRTFPRDLYDVLRMRIEPDGTLFSEYDEMRRLYEGEGHVVPFVNARETPAAAPTPATKVGRNDPCPCGSGKKYKRCCGRL